MHSTTTTPILLLLFVLALGKPIEEMFKGQNWESGYASIGRNNNSLFYILIRSMSHNASAPLIVWLNGGPGCASTYGLFEEMGPFVIDRENVTFKFNPYAWNNFSDMLYIDQPIGVGYSKIKADADHCKDLACVTRDFSVFFLNFMEQHPEYIGRGVFLSGESFAGHYIPAIAQYWIKARHPWLRVAGVALGNFVTNVYLEMQTVGPFLMESGVVTWPYYFLLRVYSLVCSTASLLSFLPESYRLQVCGYYSVGGDGGGPASLIPNHYDIYDNKSYYDMDVLLQDSLASRAAQRVLGVNVANYSVMNMTVFFNLLYDIQKDYSSALSFVLDSGVNTLLYFGVRDMMCNWRGGELLAHSLAWSGNEGFNSAASRQWYEGAAGSSRLAGEYTKYRNLNFLTVFDAGHLVPFMQPLAALEMIKRFVYGEF